MLSSVYRLGFLVAYDRDMHRFIFPSTQNTCTSYVPAHRFKSCTIEYPRLVGVQTGDAIYSG